MPIGRDPDVPAVATVGVEEEFHLVERDTRALAPVADAVLGSLPGGSYSTELHQSMVETRTPVCTTLAQLRQAIGELRRQVSEAAAPHGVAIAAAGTLPMAPTRLAVTGGERYRRMLADYQMLVREQLICGLQVHVGVGDRDRAVRLMQRIAPVTPLLLAITASSPFWYTGDDTGYASVRTLVWQRWPTAGTAGPLRSAADYDRVVAQLLQAGVISDPGMIYFDVRPSAHLPTLELRVCDACPSVDAVLLVAAIFRASVGHELSADSAGAPPVLQSDPLHRAAMWRAARSGLADVLVDPAACRPIPAAALLRQTVAELREQFEVSGDWAEVTDLVDVVLRQGSPAQRQRATMMRAGRATDVVDQVIEETASGVPRA